MVKYSLASIIKLKIKEAISEIIALGASNKNFQYEATLALGELGYDKVLGDLITRAQQRDDNALIILGNYGLKARKEWSETDGEIYDEQEHLFSALEKMEKLRINVNIKKGANE